MRRPVKRSAKPIPVRNTGKDSEAEFENVLRHRYGKRAYIYRHQDAGDLHGLNGHAVKTGCRPSDYTVVIGGITIWAEVKSCNNSTSFPFSSISSNQSSQSKLIRLAGGTYIFFVHNMITDTFYTLDAADVDRISKTRQSARWDDMKVWSDYESYKLRKI